MAHHQYYSLSAEFLRQFRRFEGTRNNLQKKLSVSRIVIIVGKVCGSKVRVVIIIGDASILKRLTGLPDPHRGLRYRSIRGCGPLYCQYSLNNIPNSLPNAPFSSFLLLNTKNHPHGGGPVRVCPGVIVLNIITKCQTPFRENWHAPVVVVLYTTTAHFLWFTVLLFSGSLGWRLAWHGRVCHYLNFRANLLT